MRELGAYIFNCIRTDTKKVSACVYIIGISHQNARKSEEDAKPDDQVHGFQQVTKKLICALVAILLDLSRLKYGPTCI